MEVNPRATTTKKIPLAALLFFAVFWASCAWAQPGPEILPASLPNGIIGTPYSQTFSVSGCACQFGLAEGGGLPPGLNLDGNVLGGTPTAAGPYSFTVQAFFVSDGVIVNVATRTYQVTIWNAIALSPATLPSGAVGTAYSQTLTATGGAGSFTFSVTSGALPVGLSLNSATGVISGTPSTASGASFTIMAIDVEKNFASRSYTIAISSAIALSPVALAPGTVGVPYSQAITASGGTGSFTYAVTGGALPSGLSLNPPTGVISGTPTTAGTSNFTITAADSSGINSSRAYAIAISQSGIVQVVSGDRQVVPANARAPLDLVARVVDGQGNPVAGAEVSWAVVQGSGSISSATLASDTQGIVRASFTTGPEAIESVVRVTESASGATSTFVVRSQQKSVVEPARQLIAPQALIAVTAPTIQLNNIRQRLDQLRLLRSSAILERLRISIDGRSLPPLSAFSLPGGKDGKPQRGGGASADAADPFERWGVFVNGDVNIGKQSPFDAQSGFELRSKGITLGTDYRFTGNHILGAAVGLMKADTELDAAAGTQDADGYSLSFFGSLVPMENAYVDSILTVGRNNYDSERRTSTGALVSDTKGDQWGIAVSAGYAFNRGPLTMTPFGRIEHVDGRIDAFIERGNADDALAVGEQKVKQTTLALGGSASYAMSTTWGVLAPTARLEFHHITGSTGDDVIARLAADTISLPAQVRLPSHDKSYGSFAIGMTGVFAKGFSGFVNYERQFARDTYRDERYGLGVRVAF